MAEAALAIARGAAIARFLAAQGWAAAASSLLAGDASFRRYYRLRADGRAAVLMDAPPPHEDVGAFVHVAELLRGYGLSTPAIRAADHTAGLLLLEDFGDDTYTRLLTAGADEAALYALAVDTLAALHRGVAGAALPELPQYDDDRLLAEALLLTDWYAPAVLPGGLPGDLPGDLPGGLPGDLPGGLPLGARDDYIAAWRRVLPQAACGGATLVLRDYHVDNLMLLSGRDGVAACGLLDFQDAVIGPPAYDLVSLLEDARRDVPAALRRAMTARYLAAFPMLDRGEFTRSAAILAAQRNSKIIGIFTRLWRRDGKPGYLRHIARVWRLLDDDLRHPALAPVAAWFARHFPPPARRVPEPEGGR